MGQTIQLTGDMNEHARWTILGGKPEACPCFACEAKRSARRQAAFESPDVARLIQRFNEQVERCERARAAFEARFGRPYVHGEGGR